MGKRRKVIEVSSKVCKKWVARYSAPAPEPAAAAGAASSSGIVTKLVGAKAVEEVVGARYRKEVTDLGLGVSTRGYDMMARLRTWGYQVSREACQEPHTLYLILNYLSISHLCTYLVTSSFFVQCTYVLSSFIFLFIYTLY